MSDPPSIIVLSTKGRTMSEYVAVDIYDRLDADNEGLGGSVQDDLAELLEAGDLQGFEDYFGDQDPFAFL
jgi:hypothetical protein